MNFNNHLFTYPELNGFPVSLLPSNRPHPPLIKVNPSSRYQPHYYHFITCTLNNSPPISSLHLFSEGSQNTHVTKPAKKKYKEEISYAIRYNLQPGTVFRPLFLGLLQQQQVCSHAPQIIIWILSFAPISSAPHPLQRNMSRDMLKKMFCHQPEHQPYPCRRYLSTQIRLCVGLPQHSLGFSVGGMSDGRVTVGRRGTVATERQAFPYCSTWTWLAVAQTTTRQFRDQTSHPFVWVGLFVYYTCRWDTICMGLNWQPCASSCSLIQY